MNGERLGGMTANSASGQAAAQAAYALFADARAIMSPAQIAARIGLHANTVTRWIEQARAPAQYRMDFLRMLGRPLTPILADDDNLARNLDLFFTRPAAARHCMAAFRRVADELKINLRGHTFIEPSAGEGGFVDVFPKGRRIALDLLPRRDDIVGADFLTWQPPRPGKYAVIGNPPFGLRGHLALQFINHAAQFADTIAFILPQLFESDGKGAPMKRVDTRLSLAHSERLPPDSFVYPDGVPVNVSAVFQVWTKGAVARRPAPACDSFIRVYSLTDGGTPSTTRNKHMIGKCDVYLPSTCYAGMRAYGRFEDLPNARGYGVLIRRNKRDIKKLLMAHDWTQTAFPSTNSALNLRSGLIKQVVIAGGFSDE